MYNLLALLINQNDLNVPKPGVNDGANGPIAVGLQIAFGFAGAIALIIITLAGFKYVLSQGNPQETAKAKNTIMYALVGLVVCIMASAIVRYVLRNV